MAKPAELEKLTGLASRFGAFVAERHPFALADALEAFETATGGREPRDEAAIEALRPALRRELTKRLQARAAAATGCPTRRRGRPPPRACAQAHAELLDACDGFLRRAAIAASLTRDERLEILRGMVLTRATDNRLKTFFTGGEVRTAPTAFQGKGFRSLGPGSDLRAPRSACAAARAIPRRRRPLDRRRHRPDDPRSRRHAGDAPGAGDRAHGAQRADGQGRPADRTARTCTSATSPGASCRRPRR